MPLLSDLYDVTLKRDNRGASKAGWIRPTIGEMYETTYDFRQIAKSGSATRSFLSTNTADYLINDLTCGNDTLTLPNTATTRNYTPVRERVYLNSAWGRTNQCNTPSGAPGSTSGQFGTLKLGIEKANGSTVNLMMLRHRKYTEGSGQVYRLYSSTVFQQYLATDYIAIRTIVSGDGVVTGSFYLYNYLLDGLTKHGLWVYANGYQLADTDRLYIEHSDYARPDYVYGNGIPLYGIDTVAYTTNTEYTAETTEVSTIDNISYVSVDSLTFDYSQPTNTTILALVSFDGRNTWKKWNGSEFVTETDVSLGNTLGTISTAFTGMTMNLGSSLDFKFHMKTTNTYNAPYIKSYTLTY